MQVNHMCQSHYRGMLMHMLKIKRLKKAVSSVVLTNLKGKKIINPKLCPLINIKTLLLLTINKSKRSTF